jgi:O-antigen/teichoic acid export membrane protein
VVNVALNVTLIPYYGALGAAMATLTSMCIFAAAQYVYVSRCLPAYLATLHQMAKPAAAVAVMALFVWVRRADQVLILIAVAAVVYVMLLFVTRSVSLRELRLIRRNVLVEPESYCES